MSESLRSADVCVAWELAWCWLTGFPHHCASWGDPEHLQCSSVIRAKGLPVCPGKSYTFPRRPDSSCTHGVLSREMHPLNENPNISQSRRCYPSARPLHRVARSPALFSSLAIALLFLAHWDLLKYVSWTQFRLGLVHPFFFFFDCLWNSLFH